MCIEDTGEALVLCSMLPWHLLSWRAHSLILKYQRCHHVAALKSVWCWPQDSLGTVLSPSGHSWPPSSTSKPWHFSCSHFLLSSHYHSPFWKATLTNYDSWLEKRRLFTPNSSKAQYNQTLFYCLLWLILSAMAYWCPQVTVDEWNILEKRCACQKLSNHIVIIIILK